MYIYIYISVHKAETSFISIVQVPKNDWSNTELIKQGMAGFPMDRSL